MSMVEIKDLKDAKRLSALDWDGLLPSERQRAISLLGIMYRHWDELATHTMFANGRIEELREFIWEVAGLDCERYTKHLSKGPCELCLSCRARAILERVPAPTVSGVQSDQP